MNAPMPVLRVDPRNATQLLSEEIVLTVEEVARVLRITRDSVKNLHRTGQLKGVIVGRYLLWRPCDVRAFVEGLGSE